MFSYKFQKEGHYSNRCLQRGTQEINEEEYSSDYHSKILSQSFSNEGPKVCGCIKDHGNVF